MSNSTLVTYTRLSPHRDRRTSVIDTITIHCYVGQVTAKQGCDYFATTSRTASANYVVGKDGSIGLSVEEKDRAFTSSSKSNDNRAVTIEVACDIKHPYAVTEEAYNALIILVADICRRNNIKELKWKGDKSLIGQTDKQNMTVHRWFAAKACPGDYLYERHGDIANRVNQIIKGNTLNEEKVTTTSQKLYRVRKTWKDASSQLGAFKDLANAKKNCKTGYSVFDWNGNVVDTGTSNKKDVTTVAKEVLQGKWGNGAERKKRLEAAGYNYNEVQNKVNQLL